MKTLKSSFIAAGLVLAATLQAASVQAPNGQSRAEQWLTHYYENPQPAKLPQFVHELSREGYFDRSANHAMAIGFFATVFAQNPREVNYWLRETADLPDAHRRVLVAAAWQAGSPRGADLLSQMSASADPALQGQVAALVERGPTDLASTPVRSAESMNLQWGAFLAQGDQQPILAVLAALGSGESNLTTAARYSLAQNAAQHRRVFDICRAQLERQPEAIRSEIRAALNEAAAAQKPRA
jgi:hypothetical protein